MPFTPNEIAREVAAEITGREDDDDYNRLIEIWANDAHADIQFECRWFFNINAVVPVNLIANQATDYALASSVGEYTAMRLPALDQEVEYKTEEELVELGIDLEQKGSAPIYFYGTGYDKAKDKYKIRVVPIPTSNMTAELLNRSRVQIVPSNTAFPLPDEFRGVLKYKTRAIAFTEDGRTEIGSFFLNLHEAELEKRRKRYQTMPIEKRRRPIQDIPIPGRALRLPANYP